MGWTKVLLAGDAAELSDVAPQDVIKQTASAGVATFASRDDHLHDVTVAAPTAVGTTAAEGSATSLVRSDHVHDLGDGCIDAAALFAADVVEAAAVKETDSFEMAKLTLSGADPGSEIVLTPKASSASTTEGTLFYDADDNHLYVYVV